MKKKARANKVVKTIKGKPYDIQYKERRESSLHDLDLMFKDFYGGHKYCNKAFDHLLSRMDEAFKSRSETLKKRDYNRTYECDIPWFLSNELVGMSLYVDRFCGDLKTMKTKLPYFKNLGVNFLHLMPLFESPDDESDGGYAVSDFRKVHPKFGNLADLKALTQVMHRRGFNIMLDIVLNHTSHKHEWVEKAKAGDPAYQEYYYLFDNEKEMEEYRRSLPEVFPEAAPGNFTFIPELKKWAMTVFHNYQWDLNFSNPMVFVEMLDTILFYANMGVDILRIDAPAFIWKEPGTSCQNLPQVHQILQLLKKCVSIVTPGMALLGEAIVAPEAIMKYFGTDDMAAKECDVAYNATQMALQWDALATQDTSVMLNAQYVLSKKPMGTTWITYTRCHDDIGLAYDDYMIRNSGYDPYPHRNYIKEYYSGTHPFSDAKGRLFSVNEKTGDARISGSLASLCGLESALQKNDPKDKEEAVKKIILMQAMSFFIGGIPMLFYGDELGYTNDYSYEEDSDKSYDNRWMHRPLIDWEKNKRATKKGTVENDVFRATQRLITIRKKIKVITDKSNLTWLHTRNKHVAGFLRAWDTDRVYCLFNFSNSDQWLTNLVFKDHGIKPDQLYDYWRDQSYQVEADQEYFYLPSHSFFVLKPR